MLARSSFDRFPEATHVVVYRSGSDVLALFVGSWSMAEIRAEQLAGMGREVVRVGELFVPGGSV